MRGTDASALAVVATEARLAELDAANLPADIAAINALIAALNDPTVVAIRQEMDANSTQLAALVARLTLARAGYLDNLNGHTPQTGDSFARLAAPAGASVSADIAAINALIAALNDLSAAQVNAQVVDVMTVDTIAELAQAAPSDTPTIASGLMALYMALINQLDVTAGFKEVHNAAGTVIFKKALTEDGTTYREAKGETGP